mmetsp:Transcript_66391/g.130857  ORF Transcript_66391/g.130857 Transcript_66391/m.130857 type:complete len:225 (+) Transcript_66391:1025-1699(+)
MVPSLARSTRINSSCRSFISTKVCSVFSDRSSTRPVIAASFLIILSSMPSKRGCRLSTFSCISCSKSVRASSRASFAASRPASRSAVSLVISSSIRAVCCCCSSSNRAIAFLIGTCASSISRRSCASVLAIPSQTSAKSWRIRASISSSAFCHTALSTLTSSNRARSSPCLCNSARASSRLAVTCLCNSESTSRCLSSSTVESSNCASIRRPISAIVFACCSWC